jgi:hypothetical protein
MEDKATRLRPGVPCKLQWTENASLKMPLGLRLVMTWRMGICEEKEYLRPETRRTSMEPVPDKLVNEMGSQSKHDRCVFYRGNVIYLLYTDDSILAGPDEDELNDVVETRQQDLTRHGRRRSRRFLRSQHRKIDDDAYHLFAAPPIDQIISGPTS